MYTIQNKNDIRYQNTHTTIRNAYKELLTQKNYLSISVTEICKLAHINRGTFYIHYKDSFSVMNEFEDEIYQQIIEFINNALSMSSPHHELSQLVTSYLRTEDGVFFDKVLNGVYGSGKIYIRICDYISSSISPSFINAGNLTNREAELLSIYLSNATVAVFRDWHRNEYQNLEEEYKFAANLTDSVLELFNINLSNFKLKK